MRYLLVMILMLFVVLPLSVIAQDMEICPKTMAEVSTELQVHLLDCNDRMEVIEQTMKAIISGNLDDDEIFETVMTMMQWAVMAESAGHRYAGDVVDCGRFAMLNDAYLDAIDNVYAMAAHAVVLMCMGASVQDKVREISAVRSQALGANIELWKSGYAEITEHTEKPQCGLLSQSGF